MSHKISQINLHIMSVTHESNGQCALFSIISIPKQRIRTRYVLLHCILIRSISRSFDDDDDDHGTKVTARGKNLSSTDILGVCRLYFLSRPFRGPTKTNDKKNQRRHT